MKALDPSDENAKREYDAYRRLALEASPDGGELHASAEEMAGYRDLPMGKHDEKALSDPKLLEAFERFVSREKELPWFLQERIARDQDAHRCARRRQRERAAPLGLSGASAPAFRDASRDSRRRPQT